MQNNTNTNTKVWTARPQLQKMQHVFISCQLGAVNQDPRHVEPDALPRCEALKAQYSSTLSSPVTAVRWRYHFSVWIKALQRSRFCMIILQKSYSTVVLVDGMMTLTTHLVPNVSV